MNTEQVKEDILTELREGSVMAEDLPDCPSVATVKRTFLQSSEKIPENESGLRMNQRTL